MSSYGEPLDPLSPPPLAHAPPSSSSSRSSIDEGWTHSYRTGDAALDYFSGSRPTFPPSRNGSGFGSFSSFNPPAPLARTRSRSSMVIRRESSRSSIASMASDTSSFKSSAFKKQRLMAEHLYRTCLTRGWFPDEEWGNIVLVRTKIGPAGTSTFESYPPEGEVEGAEILVHGIATINAEVAVIITSHVVQAIMADLDEAKDVVKLTEGVSVQVIESLEEIGFVKRHQYAAFVRSNQAMVLWADDVPDLVPAIQKMHELMIDFIWNEAEVVERVPEKEAEDFDTLEEGLEAVADPRPTNLMSPLIVGLVCGIDIMICATIVRSVLGQFYQDGSWPRLFILLAVPFQFVVTLFFCNMVISVIMQLFGPVKQMHTTSRYYSGKAPPRMPGPLPHFTIIMPVYKEPLDSVLQPTIRSIQAAIRVYELQGGSASFLVCDDGMQLLNEDDLATRKVFYQANTIGWVARPGHSKDYPRAGKFKKASNMNFTMELTIRVEQLMNERRPVAGPDTPFWSHEAEEALYRDCLPIAIAETNKTITKTDEDGKKTTKVLGAWADGQIRIGELILIIDSDTRVPEDCFMDAASEMHFCPDLGILQHESDVMYSANHFFENGIAFFTQLVNTSISWVCANGDVAPFVGHNAFLRWKVVQEVAELDHNGIWKIWSECHVSEDFDMALRTLLAGYVVRWASYSNGGFQEGVSLTAEDEINRWQKYAFGVGELIFHPLKDWIWKGPFTEQIRMFLFRSPLPIHYKFSSMAYCFSYLAIAIAWPFSTVYYVLYGEFVPSLDGSFMPSWNVTVALFVVFGGASNFAFAVLRFRSGKGDVLSLLLNQFKWWPFFFIFFGGLSWHVSLALLAQLLSFDMSWSSTNKEATETTFKEEIVFIAKRFWIMYTCTGAILIAAGLMWSDFIPMEYAIQDWVALVPLILTLLPHVLYPIVLNPALMRFKF